MYIAGFIAFKHLKLHKNLEETDTFDMGQKYVALISFFSRGKLKEHQKVLNCHLLFFYI